MTPAGAGAFIRIIVENEFEIYLAVEPMLAGAFLGVLGGMGPAATADFLAKLAQEDDAQNDQDHVPVLVWGDCRTPDRTAALLQGGPSPESAMIIGVRALATMGAAAVVIPCNTAHAWATSLSRETPLLHIVDAVAGEADRMGARSLGLLGTAGTIAAGIYQTRLSSRDFAILTPTEKEQTTVDLAIAAVKAGRIEDARSPLTTIVQSLYARGADAVVLACTEIPLAFDADAADRTIDATRALARTCVQWWRRHQCTESAAEIASDPALQ